MSRPIDPIEYKLYPNLGYNTLKTAKERIPLILGYH